VRASDRRSRSRKPVAIRATLNPGRLSRRTTEGGLRDRLLADRGFRHGLSKGSLAKGVSGTAVVLYSPLTSKGGPFLSFLIIPSEQRGISISAFETRWESRFANYPEMTSPFAVCLVSPTAVCSANVFVKLQRGGSCSIIQHSTEKSFEVFCRIALP